MTRYRIVGLVSAALFLLGMTGCDDGAAPGPAADARLQVYSGLPPVAYIAGRIGGEAVRSGSVLPEGRSPHDYSPGPHDIRGAAGAKLFFTTGMNFENNLTRALRSGTGKIVDVTAGIKRIPFDGVPCTEDHDHSKHDHDHDHDHRHGPDSDGCGADGLDPHVWLSLENAGLIADSICDALSTADPVRAAVYRANLAAFRAELATAEAETKSALAPYRGREFYVYHPAFGYFADMTGLKQVAVELGGREATPAHLAEVIRRAKAGGIRVVFVQPQFNPTSARALAGAISGEVVGLDPLAADLPANIRRMTDVLKHGFEREDKK